MNLTPCDLHVCQPSVRIAGEGLTTVDLESLCSPEERVEAKLGCGRQTFEYEEAQLLVCSLCSALSCSVHVSQPSNRRDDKFERANVHLEVVGEIELLTVDRFLTSIASIGRYGERVHA